MIKVDKFTVNPVSENTFVLSDETKECVIIDPGFCDDNEKQIFKDYINKNGLKPIKIINTHCHFDHIWGVEFTRNEYKIPFCAHSDDAFWVDNVVDHALSFGIQMTPVRPIDTFITENSTIKFGNSEISVFHIPGHTPGHVVFYSKADQLLIAGDVLFYGSIGRTDLQGGNHSDLVNNIKEKLLTLPEETIVYCGHGPETNIGFEKKHNPYLL